MSMLRMKLPGRKPFVKGEVKNRTAIKDKEIEIWRTIQKDVLTKAKEIQKENKAQKPEAFSHIVAKLKLLAIQDEIVLKIRGLLTAQLEEKKVSDQLTNLDKISELINGEVFQIQKKTDQLNKGFFVTLLALSSIPALFSTDQVMTGMAIGDVTSYTSTNSGYAAVGIYFFAAIAILILAIAYMVLLFKNANKEKTVGNEKTDKVSKKIAVRNALHGKTQSAKDTFTKIHSKLGALRMNDKDASKYVVAIVGAVGFIAILIVMLR